MTKLDVMRYRYGYWLVQDLFKLFHLFDSILLIYRIYFFYHKFKYFQTTLHLLLGTWSALIMASRSRCLSPGRIQRMLEEVPILFWDPNINRQSRQRSSSCSFL